MSEQPQPAGQLASPIEIHAELSFTVWPPYVGLASGPPGPGPIPDHEPYGDINYSRGMVAWRTLPDGDVVGRATIFLPAGVWWYVVFCSGPHREALMGAERFEHPVEFLTPGILDLDPIRNQRLLPRQGA